MGVGWGIGCVVVECFVCDGYWIVVIDFDVDVVEEVVVLICVEGLVVESCVFDICDWFVVYVLM